MTYMKHTFINCTLVMLFFCLIFASCGYSSTYRNRSDDKLRAEEFCSRFYSYLNSGERDSLTKLFKDPAFAQQGLFAIIDTSLSRYGEIKSVDVEHTETFVRDSANTISGRYEVIYEVERSRVKTRERFQLLSDNGPLEIVRYDVAPEGIHKF